MSRVRFPAERAAAERASAERAGDRSHSALRALAGATLLAVLGGCATFPFLQPAPAAAPVEVPPEPEPPTWTAPTAAAVPASDADGVARLEALAEVWHTVRWFHPDVVHRPGAWDTVYLRHVDAVREARSDEAFVAAVHTMLGELSDPETGVVVATDSLSNSPDLAFNAMTSGAPTLVANETNTLASTLLTRTADSLVMARPIRFATERERSVQQQLYAESMVPQVPAQAAVLDLRADSGGAGDQRWMSRVPDVGEWPAPEGGSLGLVRRSVVRDGRTSLGEASACCTRWSLTTEAVPMAPAALPASDHDSSGNAARAPARLAVVVDDATVIPPALFSLHTTGQVVFVSTGTGVLRTQSRAVHIPLVGGLLARVRTEALLLPDGQPVPARADTVVPPAAAARSGDAGPRALQRPDTADAAVQAALAMVRRNDAPRSPAVRSSVSAAGWRTATAGSTGALSPDAPIYPSHPERLLAVTKLWSAVRLFNPYLPMADESWDAMYREAIGDAERATSSRTYAVALFRFAAHTDASQVTLDVPDHPEFGRRAGRVPFVLRLVDRRALIAAIDDSVAERAGLQVGDEVVSIGGEPIDKRLGRLRDLMPASNSWSRDQQLERWLETGPATVLATFKVQRGAGAPRDLEFAYAAPRDGSVPATAGAPLGATRTARTVDSLQSGIWLVRLETDAGNGRLGRRSGAVAETPPLPAGVATAEGVIVDARGVRSDAALQWLAGSALDADGQSYARDAVSDLVGPPRAALRTPELDPARRFTWTARVAPPGGERFRGPMVILVDATTQGAGELLALRLAAGGPTRILMGTTTAGAVGEVRRLHLPGQVTVQLPVSDVRQPDGRFVQRLGVPPAISVSPTVDGVRAGRDEQLEAARQWLMQQLAPPSRRR